MHWTKKKSRKPPSLLTKTENQRLNSRKPANRRRPENQKTAAFKCENRKTEPNIGHIRKTENPNAPLRKHSVTQLKPRLRDRGYPDNLLENTLSETEFSKRKSETKNIKRIYFVVCYRTSIAHLCLILKNFLVSKWHLIENQPSLREIYKDPLLLSY